MNEIPNRTYVVFQLLREGKGFAISEENPLPQRVIESFYIAGQTTVFADGTMTLSRYNRLIRV